MTAPRSFFRSGDSKGMLNQFIAGNYSIELSGHSLHFSFILDSLTAGPTEDDQEARFLKSACSNDEFSWVTMALKILVSSAKVETRLDFTTLGREFA